MSSSFDILNAPPSLLVGEAEIKALFSKTEKNEIHLAARNILINPSSRLEDWMKHHNLERKKHSQIAVELIPLFSKIADLVSKIDTLARQKKAASTILLISLLDKKLFQQKEEIDALTGEVTQLKENLLTTFVALEDHRSASQANATLQSLKFLQKWEAQLNEAYGKLFS